MPDESVPSPANDSALEDIEQRLAAVRDDHARSKAELGRRATQIVQLEQQSAERADEITSSSTVQYRNSSESVAPESTFTFTSAHTIKRWQPIQPVGRCLTRHLL